eukprot:2971933-Amphidinium_carterae.1
MTSSFPVQRPPFTTLNRTSFLDSAIPADVHRSGARSQRRSFSYLGITLIATYSTDVLAYMYT